MNENWSNTFQNKKIAIVGFGREGKSTYSFIRKYNRDEEITILDRNPNILKENPNLEEDKHLHFVLGENYLSNLEEFDLIMKTPGVSFYDLDLSHLQDKITSQMNLFLEHYAHQIIAITGTKGKSTTSSLIYQVLKDQGKDVYLCGNIGIPVFEEIEKIKEDTYLVVEMSAYQTEFIKKSPHIALILNLYPEHLDYFRQEENYYLSKLNVFFYQVRDDYAIYSCDNETLKNLVENQKSSGKKIKILSTKETVTEDDTIFCDEEFVYERVGQKTTQLYDCNASRKLLGRHNLENIMFVLAVVRILHLDLEKAKKSIEEFSPLPHRMEEVGTYQGIRFYNDSIATIPSSTIHCLETLKNVNTLILGGKDRGIDYTNLIEYLRKSTVENIICLKDTGYQIGKELEQDKHIYYAETMEEAVRYAYQYTKKNHICVLSPATSSYNVYKNFEEKGNEYKNLVRSLSG